MRSPLQPRSATFTIADHQTFPWQGQRLCATNLALHRRWAFNLAQRIPLCLSYLFTATLNKKSNPLLRVLLQSRHFQTLFLLYVPFKCLSQLCLSSCQLCILPEASYVMHAVVILLLTKTNLSPDCLTSYSISRLCPISHTGFLPHACAFTLLAPRQFAYLPFFLLNLLSFFHNDVVRVINSYHVTGLVLSSLCLTYAFDALDHQLQLLIIR